MHVAPPEFVAELRRRFPDFVDVRYNTLFCRWEFIFLSAMNRPSSLFLGWTHNPLTGQQLEPDPISGLLPFRDLDYDAQRSVIENCEATFIGNRVDGHASWKEKLRDNVEYNKNVHVNHRRAQADDWAYAMQQCDIRVPGWRKDHQPSKEKLIVPVGIFAGSSTRRSS